MAVKTWTLIDVDENIYVEELTIGPTDVEGDADGYWVEKQRLRGGKQDGVDVVTIDNGAFSFTVLLTRGMGIFEVHRDGVRFGWKSPSSSEPVHPSLVPIAEPSGIGWLDGFNEMLVRCGLESNGAPEFDDGNPVIRYPLHGRIANIPARKVELIIDGDTGQITLKGTVRESRLFFRNMELEVVYATSVAQPELVISDTVTNLAAEPSSFQLLYHANFGPPVLEEGGKAVLPLRALAPRDGTAALNIETWETIDPPTPGSQEVCFYTEPATDESGDTLALLHNRDASIGVAIGYNATELPCFSLWKSRLGEQDGYVAGLEPATNFPNVRSFEEQHNRVVPLGPGQSETMQLTLSFITAGDAVQATIEAIAELQKTAAPEIFADPRPGWSPTEVS